MNARYDGVQADVVQHLHVREGPEDVRHTCAVVVDIASFPCYERQARERGLEQGRSPRDAAIDQVEEGQRRHVDMFKGHACYSVSSYCFIGAGCLIKLFLVRVKQMAQDRCRATDNVRLWLDDTCVELEGTYALELVKYPLDRLLQRVRRADFHV